MFGVLYTPIKAFGFVTNQRMLARLVCASKVTWFLAVILIAEISRKSTEETNCSVSNQRKNAICILPRPIGGCMVSESTQKFRARGEEEPMRLRVSENGTLDYLGANVRVKLDKGQVTLSLEGDEEKFPLEQSSETAIVSVNLDRRKVAGVKVNVGILYNLEAGNTLVNLTRSDLRFLLENGEVFTLPANRIKGLPNPVPDVIFVTEEAAIARQARHAGRRDVIRPDLVINPVTGPIIDERGRAVLIRAFI